MAVQVFDDTQVYSESEGYSYGRSSASDEDLVGFYLQDIGGVPLLTAQDEVELAKAIERGKEASERLESGELSEEDRDIAIREREAGMAALNRIVECNLRLVVSIARRYSGRGMPLSDLIEEGNIGLMRAAEKFDYHRGFRFSTYATWWIRQAVIRSISSQSRVIRLPIHVSEMMSRMSKASHKLCQDLGREPSSEELASAVEINPERVREIARASQQLVSLEQHYGEGTEGTVADVVEDKTVDQPAEQTSRQMLREQVHSALLDLTDRERRVICLRYGIVGNRCYTLEEVGKVLGLTRERIRQIEKEALCKLREQESSASLRAYMD